MSRNAAASEQWHAKTREDASRDIAVHQGVGEASHFNNDSRASDHYPRAIAPPIQPVHENPKAAAVVVPNISYNTTNMHDHSEEMYALYYEGSTCYDYPMMTGNFGGPSGLASEYHAASIADASLPTTRAFEYSQGSVDATQAGFHVTKSEIMDRQVADQAFSGGQHESRSIADRQVARHDTTGHSVVDHPAVQRPAADHSVVEQTVAILPVARQLVIEHPEHQSEETRSV